MENSLLMQAINYSFEEFKQSHHRNISQISPWATSLGSYTLKSKQNLYSTDKTLQYSFSVSKLTFEFSSPLIEEPVNVTASVILKEDRYEGEYECQVFFWAQECEEKELLQEKCKGAIKKICYYEFLEAFNIIGPLSLNQVSIHEEQLTQYLINVKSDSCIHYGTSCR